MNARAIICLQHMTVYLLRQNKETNKVNKLYTEFNEENIIIIIVFLMCAVFIAACCCKVARRTTKAVYVGYIEPGIPIFNLEGEQIR